MKDIKERVRDKNPKIRNPAARLPKELVRSACLLYTSDAADE